jgi:hypothetical protein
VWERGVGTLGAGRHVIVLYGVSRLAAGFYIARLTRGDQVLTQRVLVTN